MDELSAFLVRVSPPQTPALVVRRSALEANLAAMQAACAAAGVALRPHGKMHKSSALARMQLARGAVGLCCQTVGEAEAFAAAGVRDLLVTAPVPPWGAARLARLAASGIALGVVADSLGQVAELAKAAGSAGGELRCLVDVDLGLARAGVAPEEAPALVRAILAAPGLVWGGVQSYWGHLQHLPGRDAPHAEAMARLGALVTDLRGQGLDPLVVTGGGTGTAALDLGSGVFTEIQPGSYAFMDVQYGEAGARFAPALFCAATVVSARHATHVTCDAGLKALSADGPPPRVVAGAPGASFRFFGDEHGAIIGADPPPTEGALVWLQPGHVDPTVALHDALFLADECGGRTWVPVDARRTSA
jgi:D-serine deaminase-like pyridoxal phosphate-dependent protein